MVESLQRYLAAKLHHYTATKLHGQLLQGDFADLGRVVSANDVALEPC